MASPRSDVPMSLSRRFLSLPQELEGPSLPPQVAGRRCGTVVLCVAHILESAVSSRPLPTLPLVRVRWWGEAQPQSLFRPSVLSNERAAHVADAPPSNTRAIAMNYPVVVPPFQLVEYFTDMRNLTLEVIDRSFKMKFGECKLTLDVQSGNSVMTAEEKLVALRREDVLCEIKPCDGEEGDVLGYLTVSFDVRWSDLVEDYKDEAVLSSSADSLPSKRKWTEFQVEKEDLSTLDVESVVSVEKNVVVDSKIVKKEEMVEDRGLSDESQRIRRLLEKGKALKQSMERAVKDKEGEFVQEGEGTEDIYGNRAMKEVRQALLLASDKKFTPTIFGEDSKLIELPLGDMFQHNLPALSVLDKARMETKDPMNSAARANAISKFILPDQVNTLSLTYDSLELERSFVENQLRRLRDSSSVSSRFSPIEICVSHSDVASLLHQHSGENVPQVHAFSVTTSLRKRQWHLECSSTILLTRPSSTVNISTSRDTYSKTVKRDSTKQLRFRVRCENQSDARGNKRRHEQHLYPRLTKSCVLEGTVDALTLLSVAKGAEKTWATTVELFVVENDARRHGTKHSSNTRDGLRQHEVPRSKKATAVGNLQVRFAFYDMSVSSQSSESGSAENEQECESVLSSITLSPDILSEYESRQPARLEHAPQAEEGELHLAAQYDMEDAKWRLRGSELLHFGVMFEDVKVSGSINRYFQSTLGKGISRNIATETLDRASISLHYAVPSQFTTQSSTAIKFERTIRRKLRTSHWFNSAPILQAEFSGHIHVFQSLLGEDSSKYFRGCQLIIEVWLHASKNSDRTLLGLSKVPLKKFSELLRLEGSDLHDFCTKSLPYVGVDGRFPIDNPFNGDNAGHLRARVCMGTAEQILAFATTIRSFVKFQGVVRGVLFRKRLYAISPVSLVSSSRVLGADTIGSEKECFDDTFIVGYRHEGALTISSDKLLQWTQVSKEPNVEATEAKSNVGGSDSAVSSLVAVGQQREHRLEPENCSVGNTVPCSVTSTTETLFIGTVSDADELKVEETQCEFESELGQGFGSDDEKSLRHEESSTELSSAEFDGGSDSVTPNLEGVEQSKTQNSCVNVSSDASELDLVETPRKIESEAGEGFGSEDGTWRRRVSDEFCMEASPTESDAEGSGGVASSSEAVGEQLEQWLEIEDPSEAEAVPACADSTTQTSSVDVGSDASELDLVETPPELEPEAAEGFRSEVGIERGRVSDEFSVETSPTKSDAKRSDGVTSSLEAVDEQLEQKLEIEAEAVPACVDSTTQTSSVDVGSDASELDPVEAPPELESDAGECFGSEDGTERGRVSDEFSVETSPTKSDAKRSDGVVSSSEAVDEQLKQRLEIEAETVPACVDSTTQTSSVDVGSDASELDPVEAPPELESDAGECFGSEDGTERGRVSDEFSVETSPTKSDAKRSDGVVSSSEAVDEQLKQRLEIEAETVPACVDSTTQTSSVDVGSDASELDPVEAPPELESDAGECFGSEDGTERGRVSDEFSVETSPTKSDAKRSDGVVSSSEAVDEQLKQRLEIEAETVPACVDSTTQTSSVDVGSDASELDPVEAPPELESDAGECFGSEDGTERGRVSDEFSVETSPTKSDAKRSDGVVSSSEAVDEQLKQRLEIENLSVAETVPACVDSTTQTSSVDVGSNANELFVSEPTPTGDVATDAFMNVAVNTDGMENQLGGEAVKLPVECADKAIQVDCTELEFLLKTATAFPTNNIESKLNDDIGGKSSGHSDAEMVELSCEVGSADDVVVDVENTDVSFSSLVSSVQRTTLEQNRCQGDIQRHNLICSEPSAPLSEKMELMYEILRELRDSYFAKPSSEPIGFIDTSEGTKEEKKQKVIADVSDAHCTCLSPNHLDDPTPPSSILPVAKMEPSLPRASSSTTDESVMRDLLAPPSAKFHKAAMGNTQNTPSKMTFVDRHPQDKPTQFGNMMSTTLLRKSLYFNGERKQPQELKAGRLSSSDVVMTTKRNLNSRHHAARKEEHSSVHSLFPHDSETERIARIMQGSMNYWMKEDSSSSSDEVGDDDDTTDDDCYF